MAARQLLFRDGARARIRRDVDALAAAVRVTLGPRGRAVILARDFGDRRKALRQDIAVLTGGTVVSDELGLSLAKLPLTDLGRARRAEVGKDETTLIGGAGNPLAIAERVAHLRKERTSTTSDGDREQLDERIAKHSGGVALIKVGAANAGLEPSVVVQRVEDATDRNHGFNAATLAYGDMLQMGVIDPARVTRLALQNAGSIAALVLTTDGMIANAPQPASRAGPGRVGAALPDL